MSCWRSVVGLVVLLFGQVAGGAAVADESSGGTADVASTARGSDGVAADLFARLRTTQFGASEQYWQQFGRALSRMAKLEGATYDPDSGTVLLVGQPAESFGPYDLDDLMVVLKAKLFHQQPLGMTIDPDPADPHGPKQVVRYFAGAEDTACGWIMFECDRLLKCYSQGKDNLTGEPMDPGIKGFGTMLQRRAASQRAPRQDRWNRFWLDADINDHQPGEQPTKWNGTQPVARVTSDGLSIRLVHSRVYLRTELMKLSGGKFVRAQGEKSLEAEQFTIHFCNEYEQFAELHPEFAQLEAISHLCALSDWLIERKIPLDVNYIATYRQRVPLQTPSWTPAITAELNVAMPVRGGVQQMQHRAIGGVTMNGKLFLGGDDGSAQKLGDAVRNSQESHRNDVAWIMPNAGGQRQFVAAMPTMSTRFRQTAVKVRPFFTFQKPSGPRPSASADLPSRAPLAAADRGVLIPNVPISLAALQTERRIQQPRAPPVVFGDERHLAVADRSIDIPRPDIPLAMSSQSDPNIKPRPPTVEPTDSSPGLSPETPFRAESDRVEPDTLRVKIPVPSSPAEQPYAPRPPPDHFRADAERTSLDTRQAVPLARSEVRQLGLAVFETPSGARTLNLPKLVHWKNPTRERSMSVEGLPGTDIVVVDQLALVSELGDIMIRFGEPQVDQDRLQLYYPTQPPGKGGVQGYYPQSSTLLFADGGHIEFNTSGFPQQVKTVHGTTVDFQYSLRASEEGQTTWPVVEKCNVVANSSEADSGEFALLAPPQPDTPEPPPPVAPSLPLAQPPGAIGVQIESPPAITSAAEHPVTPQMEPLASVPSVVETTESIVTTIVGPNRTAPAAIAKRQGASPVVFAGLVGIAILACLAFIYFQRNH